MAVEQLLVQLRMDAQQYNQAARQAATSTNQIGQSAKTTGAATGKLDKQMSGLAATAKFAVAGIAVGAVTKFGKDSVQAFLGFDDAMNQSLAIMGDVSETMRDDMSKAAREVGKSTRIGASEAAESFFFLASAGLDAEQSIAAMPQVAAFAQAGMFDMARATDLVTDAQSALGLTVDDAQQNLVNMTRVTDALTGANILANASVEQFSTALTNKAGAAMRSVGIDIEEGVAVLAAFADQGVKSEEAGTQFAIVLRDLQTRALENKDAFAQAGIAIFDARGEFRNFADVIGDIETRLSGMSDAQRKAELATLGFTDKSISALTVLLGTSDAIREYETNIREMGGITQEVADKQLESFRGQLDLLKGRVVDLQIALGEGLVPVLIEVADSALVVAEPLADLIGLLNDLGQSSDDVESSGAFQGDLFTRLFRSLPGGVVFDLKDAFDELWASWFEGDEAAEGLSSGVNTVANNLQRTGEAASVAAGDQEELASAFEETVLAIQEAAVAIEAYDTAFRRLTDPVFRAISDQQRLATALADYNDVAGDTEATTADVEEALFGLLAAQQEANSSAAALPETMARTEQAFFQLGEQLGLTAEDLAIVQERLDTLDGTSARADLTVFFKTGGSKLAIDAIAAGEGAQVGSIIFRQHGGPLAGGQTAVVGERGPELFVPSQSGYVISNADVQRLISGMSNVSNTWNFPIQSSENTNTDAQLVGAIYSVLRRMETL
jgi:TP901 family phage tail tape measure protein